MSLTFSWEKKEVMLSNICFSLFPPYYFKYFLLFSYFRKDLEMLPCKTDPSEQCSLILKPNIPPPRVGFKWNLGPNNWVATLKYTRTGQRLFPVTDMSFFSVFKGKTVRLWISWLAPRLMFGLLNSIIRDKIPRSVCWCLRTINKRNV